MNLPLSSLSVKLLNNQNIFTSKKAVERFLGADIMLRTIVSSLQTPPWDPTTSIPDLSGKVAIVTGAK